MSNEAYLKRGVSSTKEEVHKAISKQSKGIYPEAFCKIMDDFIGDNEYCTVMHADGAGTKSIIAYLYYKETGDSSVFRGIAQDSLIMNIDDLLCIGVVKNFLVSNTIGRNAHRVEGIVIKEIVDGYQKMADELSQYGINVSLAGGETADVGDLVSTIIADSTVFARLKKTEVVDCANIVPKDVIIGLSSTGKASYETHENSGIGSNGFTAARHLILSRYYKEKYPESYSNTIDYENVYCGKYMLSDKLPNSDMTIKDALLSPTRTYGPIIKEVLEKHFESVHGIIHCTGGGQVKCKNFGHNLHYIKDDLFYIPPIFQAIKETGDIDDKEMYKVFNMGHRIEICCKKEAAEEIINIAKNYNIVAKIVGRVEQNDDNLENTENKVTIIDNGKTFVY